MSFSLITIEYAFSLSKLSTASHVRLVIPIVDSDQPRLRGTGEELRQIEKHEFFHA